MLLLDSFILLFTAASIDAFSQHSAYKHVQRPMGASSSRLAVSNTAWYGQQQEQLQQQELWTNPVVDDVKNFKVMDQSNNVMNEFHLPTSEYHEQTQRQSQSLSQPPYSSNSETSSNKNKNNNDDANQSSELEQVVVRKVRANVRETGRDSMRDYIKTMCNHELLNKNEEVVLAREIQLLIEWEEEREKLEQHLIR
jgi:Sigma-70 factor, region 1.2